jgi:hypothetical protein
MENRGIVVRTWAGARGIVSFSKTTTSALGPAQYSLQWVQRAPSSGLKRPGREADHSYPSNADVYNEWIVTPAYDLTALQGQPQRSDFTTKLKCALYS